VLGRATGKLGLTRFTTVRTWGKPPPSPLYYTLCLSTLDEPRANSDSQDSPRSELGGNHHLPPYIILCAFPRNPHPNGILSQDSQMGVTKFSKVGTPTTLHTMLWGPKVVGVPTLGPHNIVCKPSIEMRSEAKLYPLLRAFQRYVTHHPNACKLGQFSTFSGRDSNCQFDS